MELYDRKSLIAAADAGARLKYLFFWGHRAKRPGAPYGSECFSQWWAGAPFTVDGVAYPTAEHFMMAEKARLFGDAERLGEILAARDPGAAKAYGRQVRGFDQTIWERAREAIVLRGSIAKFSARPDLRAYLLHTGERVLVEASPRDAIWGAGLAKDHPDAARPARWPGLNLLGFALMRARGRLREQAG